MNNENVATRGRLSDAKADRVHRRGVSPLGLAGLVCAMLAGVFVLWGFYSTKGPNGSDWQTFYIAAAHWRDGQKVYTVADGFYNPPPVLLLIRPFLLLPYTGSRIVWGVLTTIMLLVSAVLTANATGWRPSRQELIIGGWLILFYIPAMLLAPLTGNLSAPVLLSYALAFWLFARGKDSLAGAVLSLSLIKLQLAFLTLPLLVYKRRWRASAAYCVTALVILAISFPLVGLDNFKDFVSVERSIAGWTNSNDALQLDVPGIHGMLLQHWPHSTGAELAANIISVLLVLALAWYWRGPWEPSSPHFQRGWAIVVLVTVLLASYAHSYDMVLLIFPAALLYAEKLKKLVNGRAATAALYGLYICPGIVLLVRQHAMVPAILLAIVVLWKGSDSGRVRSMTVDSHSNLLVTADA
jgi:hypothetical protein